MSTQKNANPFASPEKGDVPTDRKNFPTVEYSTLKTGAALVKAVTKEVIEDALATSKLGFHFWDKEAGDNGEKVLIKDFTFVVLEVYSQLGGQIETGPKTFDRYYSNKIKDTREEPFVLYKAGEDKPIAKGLYSILKGDKKDSNRFPRLIPKEVNFEQVFVIYWIEGDRVLNLKLTTMVSREIKTAISNAEATVGRKSNPDNIKLFGLADTGNLWGFKFDTYRRAEKDGSDWKSGELYFVPKFYAGVVKGEGPNANPKLLETCLLLQSEVRAEYAEIVKRRAAYSEATIKPAQGDIQAAQGTPKHEAPDESFPSQENHHQGRTIKETVAPATGVGDDLPF